MSREIYEEINSPWILEVHQTTLVLLCQQDRQEAVLLMRRIRADIRNCLLTGTFWNDEQTTNILVETGVTCLIASILNTHKHRER